MTHRFTSIDADDAFEDATPIPLTRIGGTLRCPLCDRAWGRETTCAHSFHVGPEPVEPDEAPPVRHAYLDDLNSAAPDVCAHCTRSRSDLVYHWPSEGAALAHIFDLADALGEVRNVEAMTGAAIVRDGYVPSNGYVQADGSTVTANECPVTIVEQQRPPEEELLRLVRRKLNELLDLLDDCLPL